MNSKVTLDQAGRVVIPKTLRDELRLSPGDTLDVSVKGDEVTYGRGAAREPCKGNAASGCFAPASH